MGGPADGRADGRTAGHPSVRCVELSILRKFSALSSQSCLPPPPSEKKWPRPSPIQRLVYKRAVGRMASRPPSDRPSAGPPIRRSHAPAGARNSAGRMVPVWRRMDGCARAARPRAAAARAAAARTPDRPACARAAPPRSAAGSPRAPPPRSCTPRPLRRAVRPSRAFIRARTTRKGNCLRTQTGRRFERACTKRARRALALILSSR
jgi:hypothetical protein